jgi:hypothetical protein
MDSNEPTAWEDINPATALARQPEPRLPSSDRLQPASNEVFRNELTACLALVVPVGMTEESRREWLAVAWATLKHLPPDVLAIGALAARQKCDHPAKIVPTIIAETQQVMGWRRESERSAALKQQQIEGPKENYVTPEEAAKILEEFGLKPAHINRESEA